MRLLVIFCAFVMACEGQEFIRSCYYTNWAQYRDESVRFFPENIRPSLCSHFFYAFVGMVDNKLVPLEWNDEDDEWGNPGMYRRFNEHIKGILPSAKTLLTLGGWSFDLGSMTSMLSSSANRSEFITTSIAFLRQRNFNGLDLNFQYPGQFPSPPEDKERFTLLVNEMREAIEDEAESTGNEKLLLVATVSPTKFVIDNGYEVAAIASVLDFLHVMTYDMHGAWDGITGHHSPLYRRTGQVGEALQENQEWAANYWYEQGAPKNKIVIGMAIYGRCFSLADASDTDMGAPIDGECAPGPYTKDGGFRAYYEVCDPVLPENVTREFHVEHQVPYAYYETSWIGYDDRESLMAKVQALLMDPDNELGGYAGWMTWTLDLDDFNAAECIDGTFPLHNALNEALLPPEKDE